MICVFMRNGVIKWENIRTKMSLENSGKCSIINSLSCLFNVCICSTVDSAAASEADTYEAENPLYYYTLENCI